MHLKINHGLWTVGCMWNMYNGPLILFVKSHRNRQGSINKKKKIQNVRTFLHSEIYKAKFKVRLCLSCVCLKWTKPVDTSFCRSDIISKMEKNFPKLLLHVSEVGRLDHLQLPLVVWFIYCTLNYYFWTDGFKATGCRALMQRELPH